MFPNRCAGIIQILEVLGGYEEKLVRYLRR